MSLQLSVPVRITIAGDDKTDHIEFDLKTTIVQFMDTGFGILPLMPDSIGGNPI